MRVTVEAPFDLGLTFGLDGSGFGDAVLIERLKAKSAEIFQSQVEACNSPMAETSEGIGDFAGAVFGVRQPFGFGLRLRVSPGAFTETWKEHAASFWSAFQANLINEFGLAAYREVEEKLPLVGIPYALLYAFDLGLAYVRLHLYLPSLRSALSARGIFKAFENAGYGDFNSRQGANAMLASWRSAVRDLYRGASAIGELTERSIEPLTVDFSGFQGVAIAPSEMPENRDFDTLFRPGDAQTHFYCGDLEISATWLITLVRGEAGFEYDYNRFLYIGMCHQLSWEACRVFEHMFAGKMRLAIRASLENDREALSRRQLSRIRQFAALVISTTTVENVSDIPATSNIPHSSSDSLTSESGRPRSLSRPKLLRCRD